jgi:hypothetical protein
MAKAVCKDFPQKILIDRASFALGLSPNLFLLGRMTIFHFCPSFLQESA